MSEAAASHGRAPRAAGGAAIMVGLMSGTSADGISAAVASFDRTDDGRVRTELLAHLSRPYTPAERDRLLDAIERGTPAEYCRLNFDLGSWLADAALAVMARAFLAPTDVRAIASHGHTVWHEPPHSTWQFGEAAVIAERTGVDVVSDFRVRDVAAGGQGAPLVPMADALLFASPSHWRALQNLGGIGNVSIVPPSPAGTNVRAFDTGPGCAVIDGVTRALRPDLPYDVDGALARVGTAIPEVVDELLREPYFEAPPPKSTGRELFSSSYIARFVQRCRSARPDASNEDIIATAVSLTASSIGDALRRFVREPVTEIVLSGGGARNPVLVDAIAAAVAPARVRSFDDLFFDGEAKEAVAFALLGWLHLEHRAGNVPVATGARGARVLGKLCPA
ncbi:MAG TPA: anhydro-N-acetylmuramic acid kinase [Gemmatimonadaceae bacterium]|nr:anhydro-N-acetylmuramic acid kinase [Gemmatimonadaceae bacterium]